MRSNNYLFWLLSILVIFSPTLTRSYGQAASDKPGTVKGTILDTNDGAIPNVRVRISAPRVSMQTVSDPNGSYEFAAPPGIYEVTTESPFWYSVRRSKFRVVQGGIVVIDLYPVLRITKISTSVNRRGMKVEKEIAPSPKCLALDFPEEAIKPVLQYESTEGTDNARLFIKARLTYNDVTASADSITIQNQTGVYRLKGNVKIKRGNKLFNFDSALIELKKEIAEITPYGK
jgi:Carboxypeptidase regulatory-like domain